MQDPSAGVQQPLDKHVHLISGHQFPLVAHLNLEQAFRYLLDAPSIVKQVAPMSWTYVNAPQDGTIWLEWLSPRQNGGRFPTDGYVWGDPEQVYRQEYNGYTLELLAHQIGFRPGMDHMAAHARTRYHFIAKNPNVNAAPPDPSLWIVHYHQAQQHRIIPSNQVQADQYTRQLMTERRWMETQGRIERRDFMLHDREHWPNITIPSASGGQQVHGGGFYGANPMPNQSMMTAQSRHGQPAFPQPVGPPSAKRQRTQGPAVMSGAQDSLFPDASVEDEEFTAHGDHFDHLTPREISSTRFQQHHRWMEEVFSSPYASANIVPADLGLGLMGELKGLTEGLLDAPSLDAIVERNEEERPARPKEPSPFTNLSKDQLEEFNKRVQKHLEDGQAEIERMKAEHAAKMQEWRKTKQLTQAEKQLRRSTWEGHESALFRVEQTAINGTSQNGKVPHVEELVKSVEELTGLKVKTYKDATLIEKGGLEKEEQSSRNSIPEQSSSQQQSSAPSISEPLSFMQDTTMSRPKTDGGQETRDPSAQAQVSPTQHVSEVEAAMQSVSAEQSVDNLPDNAGDVDILADDMDLDTTDLNFDLDDATVAIDSEQQDGAVSQPGAVEGESAANKDATTAAATTADPAKQTAAPIMTSNTSADFEAEDNELDDAGDAGMFNDSTFDFANEIGDTGDEVGEGLIDFDAGDGIGMDDSAFGDALHGMDEAGSG